MAPNRPWQQPARLSESRYARKRKPQAMSASSQPRGHSRKGRDVAALAVPVDLPTMKELLTPPYTKLFSKAVAEYKPDGQKDATLRWMRYGCWLLQTLCESVQPLAVALCLETSEEQRRANLRTDRRAVRQRRKDSVDLYALKQPCGDAVIPLIESAFCPRQLSEQQREARKSEEAFRRAGSEGAPASTNPSPGKRSFASEVALCKAASRPRARAHAVHLFRGAAKRAARRQPGATLG